MPQPVLWELAARQKGLLTYDQLRDSITRKQVIGLNACGRLVAVRRGVYALAGTPPDPFQPLLAACLAGGPDVVAARVAAGALWGLRGLALDVPEIVAPRPRALRLPGVLAHTSTLLPAEHLTVQRCV